MEESAIHSGTNFSSRRTAIDFLVYQAQRNPAKVAFKQIESGGNHGVMITYADLDLKARNLGKTLQHFTSPGDRIMLIYPPGIEFITSLFACFYAGVIAVPVAPPCLSNLGADLPYLRSIVFDAKPVVVLTNHDLLTLVDQIAFSEPEFDSLQWLATDGFPLALVNSGVLPKILLSDVAMLLYSDYEIGKDIENVAASHENILQSIEAFTSAITIKSRDTIVSWLPHYLCNGLIGGILLSIYSGTTCLLISQEQVVKDPILWLLTISKYRARISGGTDEVFRACANKASQDQKRILDLSSWDVAYSGDSEFIFETFDHFANTFESCGFRRISFFHHCGMNNLIKRIQAPHKMEPLRILDYGKERIFYEAQGVRLPVHSSMRSISCGEYRQNMGIEVLVSENIGTGSEDQIGEIIISESASFNNFWNTSTESITQYPFPLEDHQGRKFRRSGCLGVVHQRQLYAIGEEAGLIATDNFIYFSRIIESTIETSFSRSLPGRSVILSIGHSSDRKVVVFCEVAESVDLSTFFSETDHYDADLKKEIVEIVLKKHEISIHKVILLPTGSIPRKADGTINRSACQQLLLCGL